MVRDMSCVITVANVRCQQVRVMAVIGESIRNGFERQAEHTIVWKVFVR